MNMVDALKIASIVIAVGAVGALGYITYRYYEEIKNNQQTTTTQTTGASNGQGNGNIQITGGGQGSGTATPQYYKVVLFNECSDWVTVTYTDPNGNNINDSIAPYGSQNNNPQTVYVQPGTYVIYGSQQYGPINSDQTINISCYSVKLVNQCLAQYTVSYTKPSGQNATTVVNPFSTTTINVQPGSYIDIQEPPTALILNPTGIKKIGPITSNTTHVLCNTGIPLP